MAETQVSLSNQALVKCGAATISSFTDGSHEASTVSVLYDTVKKGLLYYTFWNFAIQKQQLNRLTETPTDKKFLYAHSLPGDIIRIKSIFDNQGFSIEDYAVEGQKIYSNTEVLFIEYVQNMDEQYFPPFFIEAFVAKLAAEINESITGIGSVYERLLNDYGNKLRAARIADGQENPPTNIIPPGRYVEAHLGSSSLVSGRLRHSRT